MHLLHTRHTNKVRTAGAFGLGRAGTRALENCESALCAGPRASRSEASTSQRSCPGPVTKPSAPTRALLVPPPAWTRAVLGWSSPRVQRPRGTAPAPQLCLGPFCVLLLHSQLSGDSRPSCSGILSQIPFSAKTRSRRVSALQPKQPANHTQVGGACKRKAPKRPWQGTERMGNAGAVRRAGRGWSPS